MKKIHLSLSFKARWELFLLFVIFNWKWNYGLNGGLKGAFKGLIIDIRDLFIEEKGRGVLFG